MRKHFKNIRGRSVKILYYQNSKLRYKYRSRFRHRHWQRSDRVMLGLTQSFIIKLFCYQNSKVSKYYLLNNACFIGIQSMMMSIYQATLLSK